MAGVEEELQDVMGDCACSAAISRHSFASVNDSVTDKDFDHIKATCQEIARSEKKWMFLHRCRVCGTYWAEACYDRWQVMFYYLFPAPATDDPIRWLNEEAEELPAR